MLYVDITNLVAGDRVVIRTKVEIDASGTNLVTLYEDVMIGEDRVGMGQTNLYYVPPVPIVDRITFTLEQTDGTGRAFDWQILEV
jgi:hypothetical protein